MESGRRSLVKPTEPAPTLQATRYDKSRVPEKCRALTVWRKMRFPHKRGRRKERSALPCDAGVSQDAGGTATISERKPLTLKNVALAFPASRLRVGVGFLDSVQLSVGYPADSNTFLSLVFRPCGGGTETGPFE